MTVVISIGLLGLSLFGQLSFPEMVWSIEWHPIHPYLEDVIILAGHEVLMEVDDYILLIVGNPQGILDHLLWPRIIQI
jgi:hypothetical protein